MQARYNKSVADVRQTAEKRNSMLYRDNSGVDLLVYNTNYVCPNGLAVIQVHSTLHVV